MQVTIDTQKDTYEDLHKIFTLLSQLLNQKSNSYSNYTDSNKTSTATDTTNLMSMFSDTPSSSSSTGREIPNTPPDFSSFLNLTKSQELKKREEIPRIEIF